MDTFSAFAKGVINQGKPLMVFDWDKAARIIKERNPQRAAAGLSQDWEWTGGVIFADGNPVPEDERDMSVNYTYLASTWATPELMVDDDLIDCFIMQDEVPLEWLEGVDGYAHIYWPTSALVILKE